MIVRPDVALYSESFFSDCRPAVLDDDVSSLISGDKAQVMAIDRDATQAIVSRYRSDPESVYNTWFVNSPERLKAFRAIRRGVLEVISTIRAGTFGNDFKGSPLETVLDSITEQKQVFEGAAHPFYWKPKLRIPDIYENDENKRAFGRFLEKVLGR